MELWTAEHTRTLLPALAVMLIAAGFLRAVLKNKDAGIRLIPVQVLTCILILLEIGKQVLSLARGYDLYHLPFHFCSLFIFVLPAMSFYKGKRRHAVFAVSTALCASVFLLMLIYPALIYSAGNITNFFSGYFDFHTVAFHNIVMFVFVLIVALDLHEPAPKGDNKPIVLFTLCFCTVSASMAHILKTNYANYYSCNIPVLEDVRLMVQGYIGAVPAKLIYILIVSALNVGFVLMSYQLYRFLRFAVAKLDPSKSLA